MPVFVKYPDEADRLNKSKPLVADRVHIIIVEKFSLSRHDSESKPVLTEFIKEEVFVDLAGVDNIPGKTKTPEEFVREEND